MAAREKAPRDDVKRKYVTLPRDVYLALERLAAETATPFDALAEEAFRRLLKDMNVPVTVREALTASIRVEPANDRRPKANRKA